MWELSRLATEFYETWAYPDSSERLTFMGEKFKMDRNRQGMRTLIGHIWLELGTGGGLLRRHNNQQEGSIKSKERLNQLHNH